MKNLSIISLRKPRCIICGKVLKRNRRKSTIIYEDEQNRPYRTCEKCEKAGIYIPLHRG